MYRKLAERIINGEPNIVWIVRECTDTNPHAVKEWIDLMLIEAAEYDAVPGICGGLDYCDSSVIVASWSYEKPYSEQEIQEAKDWLEANPESEAKPIKWRRAIPFVISRTK